ncbi:MAG: methyltransferase [Halioglobus sp.]
MSDNFSPLLHQNLDRLRSAALAGPVLDLACGGGRNGLHLIASGIPVVFADVNPDALGRVSSALSSEPFQQHQSLATLQEIDLETPNNPPLEPVSYGAIMVFRYLHRPLLENMKAAVKPGGLVIYETFTLDQRQFGRPRNPDFLLQTNELKDIFENWDIHFSYEGILTGQQGQPQSAIAQIVASKPN